MSPRLRIQILARDSYTCQYCGRKAPDVVLHVDHVTPVASGGNDSPDNLVAACQDCNLGKSSLILSEKNQFKKSEKWSYPKDHVQYWISKLFYRGKNKILHCQIQVDGIQRKYSLATSNRLEAAKKARDIWHGLMIKSAKSKWGIAN